MFVNVLDMIFGCWHRNFSFPITARKASDTHSHAASGKGTYVVCLDCGKEFPYDWNKMKILTHEPVNAQPAALAAAPVPGFGKVA